LKLRIGDHRSFYLCNLCCKDIGNHITVKMKKILMKEMMAC
ncbi:5301_t:CDS:2, partial [Funneliformis geosporum]